jgi:hypothetical protein
VKLEQKLTKETKGMFFWIALRKSTGASAEFGEIRWNFENLHQTRSKKLGFPSFPLFASVKN